jgi:3-dehydrosphinganine reductase
MLARREAPLEEALTEVQGAAVNSEQRFGIIPADVSIQEQVEKAIAWVSAENGVPDLVVNSAGITRPGYIQELDVPIFRDMMEVNYFGTVYVVKCILPDMIRRGSGTIVNISSMAGLVGVFGYTAYGASKYAVRGFTDALRAEVKGLGIHVSIVYPPDTDTPQLEYDNLHKPPETKFLSSLNSVQTADRVATSILDGIRKKRYIILPGLDNKITYWLISLAGTMTYPVMDWLVARTRRRSHIKEPA